MEISLDCYNFYMDVNKKIYKVLREKLPEEEFKKFVKSIHYLNKTANKFYRKGDSVLKAKFNNYSKDYIFRDDKILKRTIYNYNDHEFRDYCYDNCTPQEFKEKYDYCKSIIESVFKSNNDKYEYECER